jgi:hypothetical protein
VWWSFYRLHQAHAIMQRNEILESFLLAGGEKTIR